MMSKPKYTDEKIDALVEALRNLIYYIEATATIETEHILRGKRIKQARAALDALTCKTCGGGPEYRGPCPDCGGKSCE